MTRARACSYLSLHGLTLSQIQRILGVDVSTEELCDAAEMKPSGGRGDLLRALLQQPALKEEGELSGLPLGLSTKRHAVCAGRHAAEYLRGLGVPLSTVARILGRTYHDFIYAKVAGEHTREHLIAALLLLKERRMPMYKREAKCSICLRTFVYEARTLRKDSRTLCSCLLYTSDAADD